MLWIFDATVGSCAVVLLSCVLLRWLGGISSRKQKYAQDGPQLPPGPAGLPFLGCLETLVKGLDPRKAFAWSCSYGPVIRVKTGLSETVILNDLDSIRMFLSHKNMLYRSPSWVQGASVDVGFSAYGGEMWEENRRFSLKLLRELGYGKSGMQSIIADGCEQLMIRIAEAGGQPLDLFQLVLASVCNNIGVLLFGRRYPSGHVKHQELVKSIRDEFMASRRKSMVWLLPSAFIAVARRLPFTTASAVHKTMKSIEAFVRQQIHCHTGNSNAGSRCFIEKYLSQNKITCDQDSFAFNSFSHTGNTIGFLVTGTVTVSALLMRILLLVAANVETLQARIQREIDAVVGSERPPTWDDRYATPFTMAVMWEAQRWHTLLPMGLPRWSCEDAVIGRHFVAKGTTVIPNIWAVHNDPKCWDEPEMFDPRRFLNEDGSFAMERLKRVLPFSVGKRSCPGEMLAPQEIYLYLTRTLQKFRIVPQEKSAIDVHVADHVIMEPGRHLFCCIPREPYSPSPGC
ncbi:cytochrome P450 2J1-like isoform X2 [Amblyomma americanum]